MPELRQNIATKDWVVIATERAKRPDDFKYLKLKKAPLQQYDAKCPFCPGNECLTDEKPIYQIFNGKNWQVKVLFNKFPALSHEGQRVRSFHGLNRKITGIGFHEVIVEHPLHNTTLALLSTKEINFVLQAYKERYRSITQDLRIEHIVIFKNHGKAAGTSLIHPHSQIVGLPVVPTYIRYKIDEARSYFDDNLECVFCRMIEDELNEKIRIIWESQYFVAFIPYAAFSPFHIWIFPKRHYPSFGDISNKETDDLAIMLKVVLAKLYHGLDDPDYNYVIKSIPTDNRRVDYFHWYISIVPRISEIAGFEMGTGMYINTVIPEESAAFLNRIEVNPE